MGRLDAGGMNVDGKIEILLDRRVERPRPADRSLGVICGVGRAHPQRGVLEDRSRARQPPDSKSRRDAHRLEATFGRLREVQDDGAESPVLAGSKRAIGVDEQPPAILSGDHRTVLAEIAHDLDVLGNQPARRRPTDHALGCGARLSSRQATKLTAGAFTRASGFRRPLALGLLTLSRETAPRALGPNRAAAAQPTHWQPPSSRRHPSRPPPLADPRAPPPNQLGVKT